MTNEHHLSTPDLLAQRFVDAELTPDERQAFVTRLTRDGRLRDRVEALEQVAGHARRLPRPAVSAAFVGGVLEQLPAAAPSHRPRLGWLWAPRTLQWNLAQATAVAVLVAAGTLGALGIMRSRGVDAPASAPGAATPVMVRLVVLQPDAHTVHAVGDFNGWDPMRTSLQQVSSGVWSVTLPLEPGRYEYMFVVDGQQWIGDPAAVEQTDDGFGSRNAVLEVVSPAGGAL